MTNAQDERSAGAPPPGASEVERTSPLEGGGRHLGVRRLPVTW
jgi:hypothetical protein